VAAVVAVLVGLIVWAALGTGDPEQQTPTAGDSPSRSAPRAKTSDPKPSSPSPSPSPRPTAGGMEQFVGDYLATAVSDPATGYTMLTPAFQQESGGLEGYRGFWDTVESAELQSVQADPDALTVAYTVAYQMESSGSGSGETTDDVNLTLAFDDGDYKIAAEN
jgi:hypothetical protein